MTYDTKDNTGALFKNDKREKDTHAHARGTATIDGVEYFIDAWTNQDRNGNRYQSLKFKRKDKQQGKAAAKQEPRQTYATRDERPPMRGVDDDMDVPF